MPSRRIAIFLSFAILIGGAAAAGVWVWSSRSRATPLEPQWTARVSVLAGDGRQGSRDGYWARARFIEPFGVAVGTDGTVYVSDASEPGSIRRIATDGTVSTVASGFDTPSAIAVDAAGAVYVAETGGNAIRKVASDGTVSTVAEGFNGPIGIAVDRAGRLIVADTYNDRIRAVGADGRVSDLTGDYFDTPCGVAVDEAGIVYVAETGAGAVRTIAPSGVVGVVEPLPYDGLFRPTGIAVAPDGAIYATDERGRIVEIRPGVSARTLVGSTAGFADGEGADARLRSPSGIAVAGVGRLVVADSRNAVIRLVEATSRAALRPPAPPGIEPAFDTDRFGRLPLLWPLAPLEGPFEITGTLGEPRGNTGERFHAGLDVQGPHGADVLAVRPGVVRDPISTSGFGGLNEAVRIGDVMYVHLRVGRSRSGDLIDRERFVPSYDEQGRLSALRVKRGARFATGGRIGSVNAFNHVHLNVGWPGEEHNPLRFRLTHFADTVPPVIARGGVRLFRETGEPVRERRRGRVVVDGPVRIVVDGWDQVDGNAPRRRLGLHRLGYQLLHRDGTPAPGFEAPRETIVFDRLIPDPHAPHVVYASGSGIPFYGTRGSRFIYVVTSTFRGGIATPGMWDPGELPAGDYIIRILAEDISGNEAIGNRDLLVSIVR